MSPKLLLLVLCATVSYGQLRERTLLKQDKLLSQDDIETRIVGGRKVSIVQYPYTANYGLVCGAAVLSPDWLITAAHCGNFESIYTGSTFISRTLKSAVERHVVHPAYKNKSNTFEFDYDFQLLKLRVPLILSKTTKPIDIGSDDDVILGSFATVTGWGSTYEDGPTSDNLLAVDVPIISPKECKSKAEGEYGKYVSERMLCAGYKEGGRDTCQGDSGGPLVYNNRLIGVVSFGVGCAEPDMPGVYSQVTKVKRWINDVTGLTYTL